jgi:hypothetical protein
MGPTCVYDASQRPDQITSSVAVLVHSSFKTAAAPNVAPIRKLYMGKSTMKRPELTLAILCFGSQNRFANYHVTLLCLCVRSQRFGSAATLGSAVSTASTDVIECARGT